MTGTVPAAETLWVLGARQSAARRRRVARALALYRCGRTRLLLCGGRTGPGPAEAELMRDQARAEGVADADIRIEAESVNTWQNAVLARSLAAEGGWGPLRLVTDAFHLPRAWLSARVAGVPLAGVATAWPVRSREWPGYLYAGLRELPALGWYLLRLPLWRRRQGR